MKTYKATVRNKQTNEYTVIESDYPTKAAFIKDLRRNGYAVIDSRVKTKEEYDRLVAETNWPNI